MGFVIVTVLLTVGSLNLTAIVEAQKTFVVRDTAPAVVCDFFRLHSCRDQSRTLDLPEGESELVGGYFVEYGSIPLRAVFLGRIRQYDFDERNDRAVVFGRVVASVRDCALYPRARVRLVLRQDCPDFVLLSVGAGEFSALSL